MFFNLKRKTNSTAQNYIFKCDLTWKLGWLNPSSDDLEPMTQSCRGLVEIDFPGNEDSLRETKFRDLVWRGKELVVDDKKIAEEWGKVLIADEYWFCKENMVESLMDFLFYCLTDLTKWNSVCLFLVLYLWLVCVCFCVCVCFIHVSSSLAHVSLSYIVIT